MEMTQLKDPTISLSEFFGATKIVAHDGANAFFDAERNRFDKSRPSFQAFGTLEKQRIQEESVMTFDGFESAQMENPPLIPEGKPCSIDQEDQWTPGKSLSILFLKRSPQNFSKSVTQCLRREIMMPTQPTESPLLSKDLFDQNKTESPGRPTSLLYSDSPRSSTFCALSASLTKKINLCTTTLGHSGYVFHANRVATFRGNAKKLLTFEFSYA